MKNRTIVVTGANGFLGYHLIRISRQQGWNVKAIVRRPEAQVELKAMGVETLVLPKFTVDNLVSILKGASAVFHFIWITRGDRATLGKMNLGYVQTLIQAVRQVEHLKLILPSGLGVDQVGHRSWANNIYFETKRQVELDLAASQIPSIVFRPSYILGPGDELLPDLVENIKHGLVSLATEGTTPMQPIFVEDAIQAFLNAIDYPITDPSNPPIFDLVGTEIVSMRDLINRVCVQLQKHRVINRYPTVQSLSQQEALELWKESPEGLEVMKCDTIGNPTRIQRELHITLHSIDEMIESVLKSLKEI